MEIPNTKVAVGGADATLDFYIPEDGYLVQANVSNFSTNGLKTTLQIFRAPSGQNNKNVWSGEQVEDFGCAWTGKVPVRQGDIVRWVIEDAVAADKIEGWVTVDTS
ncbi:MAG: hypothetical protein KKB59_18290 [Spirochaetes bacterium]|nr:hypothetical protein [Spirochaetota bacterium]